jgi:hypothetical protein
MRLDRVRCEVLLTGSERGVLTTSHPTRGVDAVPACFAVAGELLAVPVDRIKPKASTALQRSRNLDSDPRAALLCDHWDPVDWNELWWVRASLRRVTGTTEDRELEGLLRDKYSHYRSEDQPFAGLLVFRITAMTGWSARTDDADTG